jgi:mannose-6-phosphate isomerase
MGTRFVCPDSGILVEQFDARWEPAAGERGRTWEPGHHFEWSWLLWRYGELSQHDVTRYVRPLYERACAQGSDPEGLIIDQVRNDGVPVRRSRRVWPHAEAIKAHAAQYEAGDRGAALRALSTLAVLRARFLQAPVQGGWIDHIDAAGHPLVDDMPASTLYHVFLAFAEAHRVLGARLAGLN